MKLLDSKGTPLDRQKFTWKDLVQNPISKLDDDAFTCVRIILMNGIEQEANRFMHACARMNKDLQLPLAQVRRVDQHQQTMVNWLISARRCNELRATSCGLRWRRGFRVLHPGPLLAGRPCKPEGMQLPSLQSSKLKAQSSKLEARSS